MASSSYGVATKLASKQAGWLAGKALLGMVRGGTICLVGVVVLHTCGCECVHSFWVDFLLYSHTVIL